MMKHKLTVKQKHWLKEIPKYKQAQGMLCDGKGFCCLGVYAHTQVEEPWELDIDGHYFYVTNDSIFSNGGILDSRDTAALGLKEEYGSFLDNNNTRTRLRFKGIMYEALTDLNDSGLISPKEMAAFIKVNAKYIFRQGGLNGT